MCVWTHAHALSHFSPFRLFTTLWTVASSVHGVSQANILGWIAISFPTGLPDPGVELLSPTLAGTSFTT